VLAYYYQLQIKIKRRKMIYDLNDLDSTNIYHIMAQTVIPRPIAWIVTQNEGVVNIAPFSFFTPLSADPATVVVSIGNKSDGSPKDTMYNIVKNKKCVICMVDEKNLEKMHFSSKELPLDISEAGEFDIKTKDLFEGYPPIIENCSVAYACTFNQTINLAQKSRTVPVILDVKNIYVSSQAIKDEKRPLIDFNPVARVARNYAFLGEKIKAPIIP